MAESGSTSLSRIFSGSVLIFVGVMVNKLISFGGSVFNAQFLGDTGYGVIVIALSVYFILSDFLSLGLNEGIARNYSPTDSIQARRGVLVTAYSIGTLMAVLGSVTIFMVAEPLAVRVFHDPSITLALRILAVAIPLKVLLNLSNGTLRAVKKPLTKTVLTSIVQPTIRVVLIVALVLLGFGAAGVAGAYTISIGVVTTLSLFAIYRSTELFDIDIRSETIPRSLLSFSLPLVGSSVVIKLMNNIDTLLIASLTASTAAVGQYNVAFVLGQTTLLFLQALGFMYLPEISDLHKSDETDKAREIYRAVTKWVLFLSLPFILIAVIFPKYVLTFIYSAEYSSATIPFVILIGGFVTHLLNGPNYNTMIAFGDTRQLFVFTFGTVALNFVFNIVLIPVFGIAGAATATASSYLIRNIAMTWYLSHTYSFSPFSRSLFLPLVPLTLTAGALRLVVRKPSFFVVVVSTVLLVTVMIVGYLSSGIEEADLLLADLLEDAGLNLSIFRKIHNRMN